MDIDSPFILSGIPIAAASAIEGWDVTAASISAGQILCPDTLMISSVLPCMYHNPLESTNIRSP